VTPLGDADVHVHYCFTHAITDDEHGASLEVLSADERARASRFVFAPDARAFVAAHALVRRALSLYVDVAPPRWVLTQNSYGKPRLFDTPDGESLQFNLSHTRGLVACAVARRSELGIDVEPIQTRVAPLELAQRFFSPAEVAELRACVDQDRQIRFVEIWTLKEAFIKALGLGLSHPLDSFSFRRDDPARVGFEAPAGHDPSAWQFALFAPTPDYRLSVGVRRPKGRTHEISVWRACPTELLLSAPPCILGRFNPQANACQVFGGSDE
jgi:4'-phosphopantetheinyl transferase